MKNKNLLLVFILFLSLVGCEAMGAKSVNLRKAASEFTIDESVSQSVPVVSDYWYDNYRITATWTSSDTDIISNEGIVYRTDEDQNVTLTYTLSYGNESETKSFDVVVEGLTESEKSVKLMKRDVVFDILYIEKGTLLGEINVPEFENYVFVGLFMDEAISIPFEMSTSIDSDIILYGHWEILTFEFDVEYPGYEEYNQHMSVSAEDVTEYYTFFPQPVNEMPYLEGNDYTIESLEYDTLSGTIVDFNWDLVEHTIKVQLSEKKYSIRYYDESEENITIKQSFIAQHSTFVKYVIDSNNVIYQGTLGDYAYMIEIGRIDISNTDKISDFIAIDGLTVIITEEGKLFSFSNTQFGTKQGFEIKDYSYLLEMIGDFQHIKIQDDKGTKVFIVGTRGVIGFDVNESSPSIFTWELYNESIQHILTPRGYLMVITSDNKVYTKRSRYLDQNDLLTLEENETVVKVYDKNNQNLIFTNQGRVFHLYFSSEANDFVADDVSYKFNWSDDERVVDIKNSYILTTANKLYKIDFTEDDIFQEEDYSERFNIDLIDVFAEGDFPISIIDTNQKQLIDRHMSIAIVTNNGNVYYENRGELTKVSNVTLADGEEILYFENSSSNMLIIITNIRNYKYSCSDDSYEEGIFDEILLVLPIEDIYMVSLGSYYIVTTNDLQYITYKQGKIYEGEIVFYNITTEINMNYGEAIDAPYKTTDLFFYKEYLYGSQYNYVNGNVSIFTHIVPYRTLLFFDTGDPEIFIEPFQLTRYSIISLETPVRDGYSFDGWYMDEEFTIPYNEDLLALGNEYTLYAKWILN